MPTASPTGKSAPKKAATKPTKGAVEKPVETKPVVVKAAEKTAPAPAKPAPVSVKPAPVSAKVSPAAKVAPVGPTTPPPKPPIMEYEAFLAKLTPKDRLNIERHLAAVEEVSTKAHAKLWKRLATMMMSMAPHSAKANGQQSMQFYIQDGKYRKQIFAIEDLRDGTIHVYAADAVDEATKAGILVKPKGSDEPDHVRLPDTEDQLNVERMDGKVSNPSPFYKDMLGWNRRAIHVILPVMASDAQADATAKLLELGAKKDGAIA